MKKAGMKPCPYCTRMTDRISGCNAVNVNVEINFALIVEGNLVSMGIA